MDLQEQLEIGKQAEDFLRYTTEHPYFNELLKRIDERFNAEILSLAPNQKDAFANLMSGKLAMSTILDIAHGDISYGAEAFKQINGISEEPKGLL